MAGILPRLFSKTCCEDWAVAGSPLKRRDCDIYFLTSPSYRLPELVLKIYRKDLVEGKIARSIHNKARRYHGAANPACSVPEPILFLQDENAMLMECVDAPSAGFLLMKNFHAGEKRQAVIRKAALWLRWFHDASGVADEPLRASSYSAPLLRTREKINAASPTALSRDPFLTHCMESAVRFAHDMDGLAIPHTLAHGDFTPFNLFIHRDRMVGFDFRANRRLPVTHDICRFLLYSDLYRITPAGAAELRKYGCRGNDAETFMDAYGAGRDWLDERLWLKLQFMEITRRISSLTLPRTRLRKRMLRFFETAHLRRNARHILDALK